MVVFCCLFLLTTIFTNSRIGRGLRNFICAFLVQKTISKYISQIREICGAIIYFGRMVPRIPMNPTLSRGVSIPTPLIFPRIIVFQSATRLDCKKKSGRSAVIYEAGSQKVENVTGGVRYENESSRQLNSWTVRRTHRNLRQFSYDQQFQLPP